MNYIYKDGELYHYGVKGMKWGVRKVNKWATSKNQPSSAKSSVLAGLYAATGSKRIGKALDKSNDRDAENWKRAKDAKSAHDKAMKKYRDKFDAAEEASIIADTKWNEVQQQYKALGKTMITRILNASKGKSDAAKAYSKSWDEWESLQDLADQKWSDTKEAYRDTGRNVIDRIMNNIYYDRSMKKRK